MSEEAGATGAIGEAEIRAGLEARQFFLRYLPTIELATGRCMGAEALMRWDRDGVIVPPDQFIPQAENSAVATPLHEWVVECVVAELGEWLAANHGIHLGLNAPPQLLGRGDLRAAAERSGLMDLIDRIQVEVTERGVTNDAGMEALESVRKLGAMVAIDDFGTGDANVIQLTRLDFDVLKIDKAFVDQIGADGLPTRLLRGIVAMCREIEVEIIAEGIETAAQARCLRELGVQMGQGWFFSKPLSREDFLAFFAERSA